MHLDAFGEAEILITEVRQLRDVFEEVGARNLSVTGPFTPFMKWPGGKRWLAKNNIKIVPDKYNRYIEPFVGSGAIFFSVCPHSGIISDANEELINVYRIIKRDWQALVSFLHLHQEQHCAEYYYLIRSSFPDSDVERAARTIYLNRTCFNGIYRVNLQGRFNVPIGSKSQVLLPNDDFEGISVLLHDTDIMNEDFELVIDMAQNGDFVFADPPYTVKHNNNGFVKYNENIFSWCDQIRLMEALKRANQRGVKILMSNANHECIRDLYEGLGDIFTLERASLISGSPSGRGKYTELLLRTY